MVFFCMQASNCYGCIEPFASSKHPGRVPDEAHLSGGRDFGLDIRSELVDFPQAPFVKPEKDGIGDGYGLPIDHVYPSDLVFG